MKAQTPILCHGAFGDVIAGTTFESGTASYGPKLLAENTGPYNYVQAQPEDGAYTLVKTTAGMSHVGRGAWHLATNHTPNDPNGYMMVINASYDPGIFYQAIVPDLCPNTTYEFAAYVLNLLKPKTAGGNPSLTFLIEDVSGNPLILPYDTGEIPQKENEPEWLKKSTTFRTPSNVNSIIIKIRNNAPGGPGNDLALDDITFRACGPSIVTKIDNAVATDLKICIGQARTFHLSADIEQGVYNVRQLQWQHLTNDIWTDLNIPGATTAQIDVPVLNSAVGTEKFRLLAAENGSINTITCRAASPVITITTYPYPNPTASNNGPVCIGSSITLDVDEAGTYEWKNPEGIIISDKKSFSIPNITTAMSGIYTVKVTNIADCNATVQTTLTVLPLLTASVGNPEVSKCESDPAVPLKAFGGTTFKWSPADGLSATNISNPLANPRNTTKYTVLVGNGACEIPATVNVTVHKNPTANAGVDKKILEGESTILNGSAGGNSENYNWYWSPAEGLDDPTKLNPTASPKEDVTYTLNVTSPAGCTQATDQVIVRVFQKVTVPNTFSPNGDGVNDLWNIKALNTYPESKIKVMNREGEIVFSSTGTGQPWNGKYKGQDLPTGAYYYTINLNKELKMLSGWVMIVR